jgi:lysophospholipase L1-like esterase
MSADAPGARAWRRAVAVAALTALAYAVADATWRWARHRALVRAPQLSRLRLLDRPLVRFDAELGYRYEPDRVVRQASVDVAFQVRSVNRIAVNAQGWISHRPYPRTPDPGEFRIAVFGDSFTACTFSDDTWPDRLEDFLAGSGADGSGPPVRVLNYAMDATGVVQWPRVALSEAEPVQPDLWLVAFIEADLWRDFKWMATLPPAPGDAFSLQIVSDAPTEALGDPAAQLSFRLVLPGGEELSAPERAARVRAALRRRIDVLPWFSPRPELVLGLLSQGGVRLPPFLRPRLRLRGDPEERRDDPERLKRAEEALSGFTRRRGWTLLLHLPTRAEVDARQAANLGPLSTRLPVVSLLPDLLALPDADASGTWYQADNGHLTDAGASAYARAVARLLARTGALVAPMARREPPPAGR